jgi:hypothetical protein
MKSLIVLIILTLTICGCSPISVKQDYDSEANFSALKTFDWMPMPENANVVARPLMDKRIRNAVTDQLSAKGIKQNSASPDFLVVHHAGVKDRVDIDTWGYSYARRGRYLGWRTAHVDVQKYKEGTLILDFVDPQSKELIWRSIASGVLPDNPNPEKIEETINDAVTKMLEGFPPEVPAS